MPKNVFVFGLNRFNLERIRSVRRWEDCDFHPLLELDEIKDAAVYEFERLLAKAEQTLQSFPGAIDAIINFWDFPASALHPILCQRHGLRGPSLESVLKCGHKYWSRLEQRHVIPENIPRFRVFDPFDDTALSGIDLQYPFWVKPVLSYSGYLGFRINSERDFRVHVQEIRENIHRYAEPFKALLEYFALPDDIARIDASYCIAEEIIRGKQCTVEGYVLKGEIETYGIIDSYRFPNSVSFSRYQYPSVLPGHVKDRINLISRKLIEKIGYDNAAFNIEYFYDRNTDSLKLLEINSRISQSHSDLFQKVDGRSNHEIVVEVALGNRPSLPENRGPFDVAAKLFVREFHDGIVRRVPSEDNLVRVQRELPGTEVIVPVREGMRLSEILDQDSYSYQLAIIYMGAQNQRDLLKKFNRCLKILDFEVEPLEAAAGAEYEDHPRVSAQN